MAERLEALFNGICTTSPPPEAVGESVRKSLRDWIKRQQIQRLHGSIPYGWNPERSKFPIRLRNIDSP